LYPKLNITILPLSKYENRHDFNRALAIRVLEKVANAHPEGGILKNIYHIW
jgi:hypothetical protein